MKLSWAPLSNRQVVNSPSMRASPKFFGPMICLKGSGFKQGISGDPFTLPDLMVVVVSAVLVEQAN